MVARDLAAGTRKDLLDNQIVIIAPIFNVDGTDTLVTQDGSLGSETPHILGTRENAAGPRPQSRCREARDRRSQRHVPRC